MKQKKLWKKILKIFLWAIAGLVLFFVTLILGIRYIVLPKVAFECDKHGKTEISDFIRENNNIPSIVRMGTNTSLLVFKGGFGVINDSISFLQNGGMDFLKGLDEESLKAAKELLDDISVQEGIIEEIAPFVPEEEPVPDVSDSEAEPISPTASEENTTTQDSAAPQNNTAPAPVQDNKSDTSQKNDSSRVLDAYDRISRAASKQEMQDGLRIIGLLDIDYISSLISGGLTKEEKAELKSYVYATLSKEDVRRAMELYQKYKKYL